MAEPMQVEVVSADRVVWSGRSSNIIAKTVEGDIGILPNHEPVLAVLETSGVVILSEYARMAGEINVSQAEKELAEAQRVLDSGDGTDEDRQHFLRATAQLRAAQKAQ